MNSQVGGEMTEECQVEVAALTQLQQGGGEQGLPRVQRRNTIKLGEKPKVRRVEDGGLRVHPASVVLGSQGPQHL